MPLKLNVGASKKVGEPNYSSRGASINLELELDASLVSKPQELQAKIGYLFGVVRKSLAEELNGNGHGAPPNENGSSPNGHNVQANDERQGTTSGNGQTKNQNSPSPRPATRSQAKALFAISKSRGVDLTKLLRERFRVGRAEQLSIREASQLIDELKSNSSV